ncbi:MAG: hypothetical protein M1819_002552 [Sarea resinae]|nr:MAG: hypothetical protein M1819_002552 [Sarea resinae]
MAFHQQLIVESLFPAVTMTSYIHLQVCDEFIRRLEVNPNTEADLKALGTAMLNHYFSPAQRYLVDAMRFPDARRNNHDHELQFLRVRKMVSDEYSRNRSLLDHARVLIESEERATTMVSTHPSYYLRPSSLAQLQEPLENATTASGTCWVLHLRGPKIQFYRFTQTPSFGEFEMQNPLRPLVLPLVNVDVMAESNLGHASTYHLRNDAGLIDAAFRHIASAAMQGGY